MCNGWLKRQYYGPEVALWLRDFVQKWWTKFSNSLQILIHSLAAWEHIPSLFDLQCDKVDFKGEGDSVGERVPRTGFEDAMKVKKNEW